MQITFLGSAMQAEHIEVIFSKQILWNELKPLHPLIQDGCDPASS
jgi:hypothetical protein